MRRSKSRANCREDLAAVYALFGEGRRCRRSPTRGAVPEFRDLRKDENPSKNGARAVVRRPFREKEMERAALAVIPASNAAVGGLITTVSDMNRTAAALSCVVLAKWTVIYGLWSLSLRGPTEPASVLSLAASALWLRA